MGEILNNLEESDKVIVTTDNTNSFRSVDTKKNMTMVNENLISSSKEIYRDKLRNILRKIRELVDDVVFQRSKR